MTTHADPNPFWLLPFAAMLGCVALGPILAKHWWEKHFPAVSTALGLIVASRFAFLDRDLGPIGHALHEYASFMAIMVGLFTVTSGIHLTVQGEAKPAVNTAFLAIGAVLSNFIGTTGASMLLIRPWIRMNKYRVTSFHIVFFIFIVSNVGGCLTPIGDPPLFLGFLKGVPFFWIGAQAFPAWCFTLAILCAIFFLIDTRNFARAPREVREKETATETWKCEGKRNFIFLAAIAAEIFWTRPAFAREIAMLATAAVSYAMTPARIREKNNFSFAPVKEVGFLFFGIFLTMPPALAWLEAHAGSLGLTSPAHFFWVTGGLSSMLDNAPTYLSFLSVAHGLFAAPALAAAGAVASEGAKTAWLVAERPDILRAISLGAVFFGAMTYIGNGPNFLVKSIADHEKVRTPSFFGYVARYAAPVLIPVFGLVGLLFLK